jgi:hypothetical protein
MAVSNRRPERLAVIVYQQPAGLVETHLLDHPRVLVGHDHACDFGTLDEDAQRPGGLILGIARLDEYLMPASP